MRKNIGICTSTNHTKILRDKAIACSHYMGYVLPHFTRKAKSSPKISYNIHFCIAILKFLCSWRMPRMHIWVWLKGTLLYIEWTTLSEIVWLEILVQKTLLQCATLVSCLDFPFGHSSHSAIADSMPNLMVHSELQNCCGNAITSVSVGAQFVDDHYTRTQARPMTRWYYRLHLLLHPIPAFSMRSVLQTIHIGFFLI